MAGERFTLSTIFDAGGNLVRRLREQGRAVSDFVSKTNRKMKLLNHSSRLAGRGFSLLRSRVTGLATAVAAGAGARYLVGLEEQLTRLAIQAGRTDEEINRLKKSIFDTSRQPNIRIDPAQLLAGVNEIVERTGDLKFAEENLQNIAMAIQATGGAGKDIGALVAEFKKLKIETKQGVLNSLDTLITQGKEGAFTLGNLATQGARVVSAIASLGFEGEEAVRTMGALLQVSMMGTGSADRAATAYEAAIRQIKVNAVALEKAGIVVRDPTMLAKGVEQFRPIPEILDAIIKKSKGSSIALQKIFGDEGLRGITQLAIDYKQTGGLASLERFLKIQGDGTAIMNDSARAAKTASAEFENFMTKSKQMVDETGTPLMKDFFNITRGLNDISTQLQQRVSGGAAPEATVNIKIDQEGRAKLGDVKSKGINVDVDVGRTMESP